MKWTEKELVEGTTPPIRIGKRVFKSTAGGERVTATFWATFSVGGKQRFIPLEVFKRVDAIREAHRLAHRLETGEQPLAERTSVKLAEMIDGYLALLEGRGRAPKTMEKYSYVLKGQLLKWWEKRGNRPALRFRLEDFFAFKKLLHDNGMQDKTVADRLMVVRQLFKWASEKAKPRLIPENPLAGEPLMFVPSKQQPCFTSEQVRLILDNAEPNLRPVYAVMALTGMRFGEVRDLQWRDLELRDNGGTIYVRRGGSREDRTKSGRGRPIPINVELHAVFAKLPREGERVFSHPPTAMYPHGSRPLDQTLLLKSFKRLCKRIGFTEKFKLHTFRHFFASICARNNVSYKFALRWMGHQDSEILDLYFHMYDREAQQAINLLDFGAPASTRSESAA